MRYALLTWVVLVAGIAFVVRTALVLALRRRRPAAAAFVDRWWVWSPLVAVLVAVTVAAPILGLAAAAVTWFLLTRVGSIGSPFRPRR